MEKSAEYFGFYNMVGKFAAVIGPVLMGATGLLARNAGFSHDLSTRISITSISLLFIAGALFLHISKEGARAEADFIK